ncbi:MAG: glycosyltransferase [Gimesia sp.]
MATNNLFRMNDVTPLKPTIVITTKDRCDDLRSALKSCVSQSIETEIIVIDDASTDGTAEMVRQEFPDARLIEHPQSMGLVYGRNEAATIATGDILFSIDDDALFTTPNVVQQTLAQFDEQYIGAVAIPFVDVKKSPEIRQQAPSSDECWVTDRYIGTAHAVRKDVFLDLEGYRESYFHQGEERDFCVRLLDAGYVVRMGNADLIHHFESPKRDTTRMDLYGRRNDIFFAWLNVPTSFLPIQLIGTSIKGFWFGVRIGRPLRMLQGILMGYAAIGRFWDKRKPVRSLTYRMFRLLQKQGGIKLQDLPEELISGRKGTEA